MAWKVQKFDLSYIALIDNMSSTLLIRLGKFKFCDEWLRDVRIYGTTILYVRMQISSMKINIEVVLTIYV